jgi:hypothetical protein
MNINTDHIGTEVGRCGGKPCSRRHRFTVAQMLAELAQECTVGEPAAGYEIGQNLSTIWGRCSKNRNGLRRFSEQGCPCRELRLEFVSHVRRHFLPK